MTDTEAEKPPPIDDGVLVHEFWANRRGESVRVQIRTYEGRRVIDLRKFFTDKAGKLKPTRKGLTLALVKLPDLAKGSTRKSLTEQQVFGPDAKRHPVLGFVIEQGSGALSVAEQIQNYISMVAVTESAAAAEAVRAKLRTAEQPLHIVDMQPAQP
jgi:hypothetical protein